MKARHIKEWNEGFGPVLWWHPGEPPYVGSPLDCGFGLEITIGFKTFHKDDAAGGWPGYHEWWTPLPPVPDGLEGLDS